MVSLTDTLTLDRDARICADGSLVAEVFAARTGLQDYLGAEVDPGATRFKADQIVKVYRPESEVFKVDSLATYAAAPVTLDHPTVEVTADNWRQYGRGEINGDVARDGQRVRVPIIVRDAAAVKAATTTHKQLSMGYATDLQFPADGKHPDGTACDAYQTNLRINHIALVPAARGGPELRVVDERPSLTNDRKDGTMPHTLIVDGLQVPNVSDEAKACIEKLQGALKDEQTARAADKTAHDKAIATKDATIDDLKTKTVDQAKIDALADAKAAVVADAKKVAGDKLGSTAGKTVPEVRRMAVAARLGDAAVADKSDDYIEARFDTLKDGSSTNDRTVVNINPASQVANDSGAAVRNLARASQF
jgi:hypothetical protein